MNHLNPPYDGKLVDLILQSDRARLARAESVEYPSVQRTDAQICDLELMLNGGFSPLRGLLGVAD